MGRILNAVLLIVMIVGAGITYDMKHRAEEAASNVARLQAAIAAEKDAISVLRAEWSMLTQPSRLQGIVTRYSDHFDLQPFAASQIASTSGSTGDRPRSGDQPMRQPLANRLGSRPVTMA